YDRKISARSCCRRLRANAQRQSAIPRGTDSMTGEYKATPQLPIPSGFGAETTARQVLKGVELGGKVAIVTGGYSGIGLETTRVLTEVGARVIVPARTREKGHAAVSHIDRAEVE